MSKYRFALVSWAKGPDKDTTSIIPISWIIDLDPADTEKTYLVECRRTNHKKPTHGWPVEYAVVLQLAGKSVSTHLFPTRNCIGKYSYIMSVVLFIYQNVYPI